MKTAEIMVLCMIAAVISFLGFVVENVWLAATKGYMDNRSMCFPFLVGYGIAVILIYFIFGLPKKIWFFGKTLFIQSKLVKILIYFLGVMLCICIGEILLGKLVEKVCHFCWWNYSALPMHITQYTSIPTSSMFSSMITLFMAAFFEPLYNFFMSWNEATLSIVAITLGLLMLGDFAYNGFKMYKNRGMTLRWRIDMTDSWLYKKVQACL